MFKKSHDGKFASGVPLGTRQGVMKHDTSTSAIKDRIHNDLGPSRSPITRHGDCPSVGTEAPTLADVSSDGATKAGLNNGS